jgi:peptide/nickel transport system substrate-binding protein
MMLAPCSESIAMIKRRTVLTLPAPPPSHPGHAGRLAQGRKDAMVLAITLEPSPGLDPTGGAALVDRRSHAVQHLRDAHQDQRRRQRHAAAGRELGGLARPHHLHLQAAQGREVPERRAVQRAGGEVLVRPRAAAEKSTNKDKRTFANITTQVRRREHRGAAHQGDRSRLPVPAGQATAIIVEPKSVDTNATKPVGTGPYRLDNWVKGSGIVLKPGGTATATHPRSSRKASFRFIGPAAQTAALLAGDVDAFPRVTPRSVPQFKGNDKRFQVVVSTPRAPRPSWPSTTRRSRSTTCACAAPLPRPSTARP